MRLRKTSKRYGAKRALAVSAVCAVAFTAALAGCANPDGAGASADVGKGLSDGGLSTATSQGTALRWFGEFKEAYPDEYASFVHGGVVKESDGRVHSHAATRFHTEGSPKLQDQGAACLSCKTAEFNDLHDKYGDAVFDMAYNDVAGEVADFFSCRTCHASGDPSDGVGAVMYPYIAYAQPLLDVVAPQTAACAQWSGATNGGPAGRRPIPIPSPRATADARAANRALP